MIGFKYNNELYYYLKNYQNDVIAILNNVGDVIANYIYDSFGNTISIKDSNGDEITDNSSVALINPFRYRSYYFDKETNLYYLNNRYYNPKWGRFLNADGVLLQSSSLSGYNLYTYTNNNFINNVDENGYAPSSLTSIVSQMAQIGSQVASQIANKNNSNEYKQASGLGSLALGGALSSMSDDLLALLKLIFGKAFIAILLIGAATTVYNQVKAGNITVNKKKKQKPCTKAYLSHGTVVRNQKRLSINEAINEYKFGNNIMCDNHGSAWRVANSFPPPILDPPHKQRLGYYWHYHGTGAIPHTHIWFYGNAPQWAVNKYLR